MTGAAPGWSSASAKSRPIATGTPSTRRKDDSTFAQGRRLRMPARSNSQSKNAFDRCHFGEWPWQLLAELRIAAAKQELLIGQPRQRHADGHNSFGFPIRQWSKE